VLIVAGHLLVAPERRDDYLALASEASRLARQSPGCLEFVQAADPLEPGRILVFERWRSEADLLAFRQSDPDGDPPAFPEVLGADVKRYEISSTGPA
jgi:quinol monooxygenase YgiN